MDFSWVSQPEGWISLLTLMALEIVLGIDNIIFISILVGRLPPEKQKQARFIGLGLAMVIRVLLLLSLAWIMKLTAPLFTVFQNDISGRDLILIVGGLFLLVKSTHEIHNSLEGALHTHESKVKGGFLGILIQIVILDIIFSLDSVITAVGMVEQVSIMIIAIIIAVLVMMLAAKSISDFIGRHPSLKMMALSFLILIAVALIAQGLDFEIPKGYIYFSMAFAFIVELLNIRLRRKKAEPVVLRKKLE